MANQLPQRNPKPEYASYSLDSQNYWAGLRGSPNPPAPSFRLVKGVFGSRQKLGRYMDPYGCQAHMQMQKSLWTSRYTGFLIAAGSAAVFGGIDLVFIFLVLPIYAIWYLSMRAFYRRRYDRYWGVIREIERTGQPVWVPYSRERRKRIAVNPLEVWP
jgi:Na+-transporting methylmalonyl-CoA/oxaloacetate decarboxylase gamma subunit